MTRKCLSLLAMICILLAALTVPVIAREDPVAGRSVAGENMPLWEITTGDSKNAPTKCPENVYYGIDVSGWQGMIDWDTVADQIDFAILRCGYGQDRVSQDDSYFHRNADACERLGIPYGVYIYSYALTEENAASEARHVLRLLKGRTPTLPIYLDLEDLDTTGTLSDEEIFRNTAVFCDVIEEAGYTPGVYTFYRWWEDRLNAPGYDAWGRWMASWSNSPPVFDRGYSMWQFSNNGTVRGIEGTVDENYWYAELPEVKPNGKPKPCDGDESCPSHGFTDVPDWRSWAHSGIDFCVERGLMKGVRADRFLPNANMTRAQLVTILYRAAGSPAIAYTGAFSDVPEGRWFSNAVEWAAANGIVNGVGNGRFLPENEITREQLATILHRCGGVCTPQGTLKDFPDAAEVGTYAREAMVWATEAGLINGIPKGEEIYLRPLDPATRAQTAGIIMRYFEACSDA